MDINDIARKIRTFPDSNKGKSPTAVEKDGELESVRIVRGDGSPGPVIFGPASTAEVAAFRRGFNAAMIATSGLS